MIILYCHIVLFAFMNRLKHITYSNRVMLHIYNMASIVFFIICFYNLKHIPFTIERFVFLSVFHGTILILSYVIYKYYQLTYLWNHIDHGFHVLRLQEDDHDEDHRQIVYDPDFQIVLLRHRNEFRDFKAMIEYQEICACCLEKLDMSCVCGLECEHLYHKSCLLQWLGVQRCCPLCKRLI